MSKEKANELNVYVERLKNQLHNPSKKHNTPVKLAAFKKYIDIELTKAQNQIERLNG